MTPSGETTYSTATAFTMLAARRKYRLPEFDEPAIVAYRGGEIMGVIGSHYPQGLHLAGPFVADSAVVALRLSLLYEEVLRRRGMNTYVFSVKKDNPWIRIVQRMNFVPLSDDGVTAWFKRDLACQILMKTAAI